MGLTELESLVLSKREIEAETFNTSLELSILYQQKLSLQPDLKKVALSVVNHFKNNPSLYVNAYQEVLIPLGAIHDSEVLKELLGALADPISKGSILKPWIFYSLAGVIEIAKKEFISSGDLKLIIEKAVEQITRPSLDQKEQYSLVVAINRLFDAIRIRRIANLDKAFHDLSCRLAKGIAGGKENALSLRFEGSYAEESLARVPDDEPLHQLALRKAMNVISIVKSINTLVASQGTAFGEYLNIFNNAKELFEMKKRPDKWFSSLEISSQIIEFYPLGDKRHEETIDLICRGAFEKGGVEWQYLFGVVEKLRQLGLRQGFSPAVASFVAHALIALFEPLDKKSEQGKKFKDLFDKSAPKPREMMAHIIGAFGDLMMNGEKEMSQLSQWGLKEIENMLSDNKDPEDMKQYRALTNISWIRVENDVSQLALFETHRFFSEAKKKAIPEEFLIGEIRQKRRKIFEDERQGIGKELQLYVEVDAGPSEFTPRNDAKPITEQVLESLMADGQRNKVVLIQGPAGCGKSLLLHFLESSFWRKYEKGQPIPLFISLPALKDPTSEAIHQIFRALGASETEIKNIQKSRRFIFLLDGYDEIKGTRNLYESNKLSEWNAHVIITCRAEFLAGKSYVSLFQGSSGLKELYIATFEGSQHLKYWAKLLSLDSSIPLKSPEEFKQAVDAVPGLSELITTPFMLTLVSQVLPRLAALGRKITRADLYEEFTNDWFARQRDKILGSVSSGEIPAGFDAVFSFREFAKDLAFQMFLHETTSVLASGGSYRMKDRSAEIWARFFNPRDPVLSLSLQGIPHRKDGDRVSFIHKSILEFLVAVVFLDELTFLGDEQLGKDSFLNQKHIQTEPPVVRFLGEMLKGKQHLQAILWENIELSKVRDDITVASANAITMLNVLELSMQKKDFRGIKIAGADLSFSRMANTDFTGADLRNVNLSRSYVPGCTFDGAKLEGVYFGEMPSLLGHTSSVLSVCLSSDGKKVISGGGDRTIRIWETETGTELKILEGHSDSVTSVCLSLDGKRIVSGSCDLTIRIWDAESGAELNKFRTHSVSSVCLTSDGEKIISSSGDGTIRIWNADSGAELKKLEGHDDSVNSICLSSDGKRIFSGSDDRTIRIWDAESGEELMKLEGHDGLVTSVCLFPDGKKIISGNYDKTIRIWDAESGAELKKLEGHSSWISSIFLSFDGKKIVSGGYDRTIRIWDAEIGAELKKLEGHSSSVHSVCLSPDGNRVFSGSADKAIRIWDAESGADLKKVEGHSRLISSVCLFPDGKRIASGSDDKTIRIWDAETGAELMKLERHFGPVRSLCLSSDGKRIVSGSSDQTIRIWDAESGAELMQFEGHSNSVLCLTFDGKRIVSGSSDQTVRIWDTGTGAELMKFEGHSSSVISICQSSDSKRIVSGSDDKTIRIWDAESGAELRVLRGHSSSVDSVYLSLDEKRIISGSLDKTTRIWDAESGAELMKLQGGTNGCLSSDGKKIFFGSDDKSIRILDLESGKVLKKLDEGNPSFLASLCLFPNGKKIISGRYDGSIKIWGEKSGIDLKILEGHSSWVLSFCLSSDGKRIFSASQDNTIRIWDVESGTQLKMLEGHSDAVSIISLSSNGKKIISASRDKTIRIWDAESGAELMKLEGHSSWVESVSQSSDGKRLISGSADKTVRIWDPESGAELMKLQGHPNNVFVSFNDQKDVISSRDTSDNIIIWDAKTGARLDQHSTTFEEMKYASFMEEKWKKTLGSKNVSMEGNLLYVESTQEEYPLIISSSRALKIDSCSLSGVSGLSKRNQKLFEQYHAKVITEGKSPDEAEKNRATLLEIQVSEMKSEISGIKEILSTILGLLKK